MSYMIWGSNKISGVASVISIAVANGCKPTLDPPRCEDPLWRVRTCGCATHGTTRTGNATSGCCRSYILPNIAELDSHITCITCPYSPAASPGSLHPALAAVRALGLLIEAGFPTLATAVSGVVEKEPKYSKINMKSSDFTLELWEDEISEFKNINSLLYVFCNLNLPTLLFRCWVNMRPFSSIFGKNLNSLT